MTSLSSLQKTLILVGIDAGGSSTRVLAEQVDTENLSTSAVIFRGQSGPANVLSTPRGSFTNHLYRATEGCPEPSLVCGCFAGLISSKQESFVKEMLHNIFPNSDIRAFPDYCAAHFASLPIADVTVISGTGSIVCSLVKNQFQKSGGGGYLVGDRGSGFVIGRRLLEIFFEGSLNLTDEIEVELASVLGSSSHLEIVSRLYTEQGAPRKIARLAALVGKLAENGAHWALEIIRDEMRHLARTTANHIVQFIELDGREIRISLAGGLWKSAKIFPVTFNNALEKELASHASLQQIQPFKVEILRSPPVTGALRMAVAHHSGDISMDSSTQLWSKS